MIGFPYGVCPICTEELNPEGELLVCPSGDYKVDAERFESRWQEYFRIEKNHPPIYNDFEEAEKLLRDLQEMKIKESE
jgi:hypothetical protein